jgi:hypothetical protein
MPDRTRCLLDKVTARRILEGLLKLAEGRDVSQEELIALDLFARAVSRDLQLFILPSTDGVLRRLEDRPRYSAIIQLFRRRVEVAFPTRYFKRWARRLRDYGFTPEDAGVLALATFGTDKDATILGIHSVATFDQPMIRRWTAERAAIQAHLAAMQQDLPMPYRQAALPQVLRPDEVNRGSDLRVPR